MSDETVRRVLLGVGYQFLHSRKKDLFKKADLKKRCKFSRKVTKMLADNFMKVFYSRLMLLDFSISITLITRHGLYELWHGN